jgi:hypothetical protein
MNVLVTIRVVGDDGEERGVSTGSAYTPFGALDNEPREAFELALEHLDIGS